MVDLRIKMGLFLLYFCGIFFKVLDNLMSCWWNFGFKEGGGGGVGIFLGVVFLIVGDDDDGFGVKIGDCCCEDDEVKLDCFDNFRLFEDDDEVNFCKFGYCILFEGGVEEDFLEMIFFGGDWIELYIWVLFVDKFWYIDGDFFLNDDVVLSRVVWVFECDCDGRGVCLEVEVLFSLNGLDEVIFFDFVELGLLRCI